MSKILHFFKELFLNLVLISMVFVMIVLMYINWMQSLSIDSMPDDFIAYDQVMSFVGGHETSDYEIQSQKFVTPDKISIKSNNKFYSVIYDQTTCSGVFNSLFLSIDDIDAEQIVLQDSSLEEFVEVLSENQFAYIEFLSPLSAIINIESDIFVTDMIAVQQGQNIELFIKSNKVFYKLTISNTALEFENFETLSTNYELVISQYGVINLVSDVSESVFDANIHELTINLDTEQQIISTFLYNPAVVTNYETSYGEEIYVNDYSTISISDSYIEFESNDPRGNIFNEQYDLSATQMMDFSIDIFNEVYSYLGSDIVAHPSDFYYEDGQTVVVLSGQLNGIEVDLDEPFGIFAFSSNGLAYCKINMLYAELLQTKVSLIKTSLINTDNKIVITYDLQGKASFKYYFDEE